MNYVPTQPEASSDIRALLQGRILSRLFRQRVVDHLETVTGKSSHSHGSHVVDRMVLKGGMAMRVAHQSVRQTKDIDLDADHDVSLGCVQGAMRRAIKEATSGNWLTEVKVTEPKQTATVARWKIQGTLPETGAIVHLTVEVSFRHHLEPGETVNVPYGEPCAPAQVQVYRDEVLLLNKVEAFFSPVRDAPRDVMDMFLLFKAGVALAPETLAARLSQASCPNLIETLWAKLDQMDEARFQAEILPHWDPNQVPPEWRDWAGIRLFVGEKLEAMLKHVPARGAATRHTGCRG